MNQNLLVFFAISLLISSVYSACTTGAGANGICCGGSSASTAGQGVKSCGTNVDATDVPAATCLQGYKLTGSGATLQCQECAAGTTAGTSSTTTGNTVTTCSACSAGTYCAGTTYGSADVAPASCPTGSTSPASSDAISDCMCTDATQILDTNGSGSCVAASGFTGTVAGKCAVFLSTSADTCIVCRAGYWKNGKNCEACTANCDVCTASTNTACTDASVQFYVNASGTPTACAANCDECDKDKCTAASKGYYLTATNVVTQCPPNSTSCTFSTTVTVTGVVANYFVSSTALTVASKCTDGLSSLATADGATATPVANAAAGCTIVCSPNCRDCAVAGAALCDNCLDNFFLDSTTKLCVAITDTNRHPSCLTARGLTASDCLTCRDTDNRTLVQAKDTDVTGMCSCQATFTESGQVDATQFPTLSDRSACVQCGKGVATCQTASDTTPLAPITCTVATNIIVSTMCAASTDKVDGYFYDSVAQQFAACDTTCQTCAATGASACTACNDIPVATPASDDTVTLLKVWSNGTLPATGGVCYSQCPLTYEVQDDTRVNCVAQSFSYLISMIAVFISFILLI